jgi:hypothetical protein
MELIKEEIIKSATPYEPSEKQIAVVNRVFERFTAMKLERNKVRREFNSKTITDYVNDSMDAYNGIVSDAIKASKEDWQSLIWDHETRGKVKTIVAMITGARPFISLIGETEKDHEYSMDMFRVYEDTWKRENGAYKLYLQALSAACKGTVIVEEVYEERKQKIKEITSVNQQTGKVTFREKESIIGGAGQVVANIVPLLDFYPNENSVEIEHDCAVVKLYTEKSFANKYGKFPGAEFVNAGVWGSDFDGILYRSLTDKKNEMVEVIRYYNEDFDEFVILANGVWLNPQESDEISPIPFDHHHLPFAKTVFEIADEECFYGKSMPDLLSGEQDTRNALLRLMIDQEVLAINKPILLGMGIEVDSYQLYPGKTIKMTGPIDQMKEMDLSGSTQSAFQLLQLLKTNSNENSSIDATAQGVHSGRKTARETVILDENSKRISGTFMVMIYKLLFDRAKLRIENIKQFYTKPIQYSVLKDKYGQPIEDSSGKQVKKPIHRQIPVVNPGKVPLWINVSPEMKGCNWQIRLVEDFEVAMNRSTRVELAKALLDEAKTNPLINADNSTIDYLESLGKNPDKFYIKPTPQAQQFNEGQGVPPQNPGTEMTPPAIPGGQVMMNKKILNAVRKPL